MTTLNELIAKRGVLLADGATGTNLFEMGLQTGDAPEPWNVEHVDRITRLHQGFVDAGSDIILTNSFGGNTFRLKLHGNEDRVVELNRAAAQVARSVADAADRDVLVAGSMGPTGELFAPMGALTMASATAAFTEQDVFFGHATIFKPYMHMTMRSLCFTKDAHGPQYLHPRCVDRHKNL